jgi:Mg2+ and Co2+ transporter CorA
MFLPLTLVVGIFSMNVVSTKISWFYPFIALTVVAIVAHRLALRPDIVRVVFPLREE